MHEISFCGNPCSVVQTSTTKDTLVRTSPSAATSRPEATPHRLTHARAMAQLFILKTAVETTEHTELHGKSRGYADLSSHLAGEPARFHKSFCFRVIPCLSVVHLLF